MDQNTEQQNVDEQKKQQLKNDIEEIKRLMDQEYQQKLYDDQEKIYNVFLLGPTGAGKSTISNELNDVRIVFQTEDDETFFCQKQQNQNMKFQVAQHSMISQTDKPQAERVNQQYQVWDLPGYFDSRGSYKDLKNIVFSQSLIQESQYSQIVIVLPEIQFSKEKKLEKLVQILNNIHTEKEISIALIISMVNGYKLSYFQDKLNELLKPDCNKLKEGKKLLIQILQQNRVILFEVPVQNPENEEVYEFNQLNIQQIKKQLFNPDLFISHKEVYIKPPDETKNTLQELYHYYLTTIKYSTEKLTKQLLSFNVKYIISGQLQELEQLKSENDEVKEFLNRNINNYNFFVQQFQQDFKREIDYGNETLKILEEIKTIFNQFSDIIKQLEKNKEIEKFKNLWIQDDYKYIEQKSDILYINCIHISARQLRAILILYQGIKTICICCFLSFNLNRNLILPGITLHVRTNYFIVDQEKDQNLIITKIILKGQDGQQFQPPKAGQSLKNPQDGEEGQVGYNGQDGGNLFINAKNFKNLEYLTVDVRGGNGGQGQEGGDGKNGSDGFDGELINEKNIKNKIFQLHQIEQTALEDLATFHCSYIKIYESRGTAGEVGGNAGPGGLGGYGGKAGQFKITPDFNIKVRNKDGQIGTNGENGKPGRGGQTGRTFKRKQKLKKAFGAIRQHENLVEQQSVKPRIGGNIASFGLFTVASIFGTLGTEVKKLMSKKEWLDDGNFNIEDTFAESGWVNESKNQREIQREMVQIDYKQEEMDQFVKQTYEKWNQNQWIKAIYIIQNEIY